MNAAGISPFFVKYIAIWTSFCLVALLILAWDRKRLLPEWREYWRFLCVPWKVCLFVPAFFFVTFAGRLTDDETWDWVTGSGMAILTFLTAPWVVGLIYLVFVGRRPARYLVVALALLLFSSSWFYDGYLLWRDGAYTGRWLGNLVLSPFIYMAAGLLWNLEAKPRVGFHDDSGFQLSFVREDWPSPPVDTRFGPILFVSIPLILIAAFVLVAFVNWQGLL
jgi:hypothetical protein